MVKNPRNPFELVCSKCGMLELLDTATQDVRREVVGWKPRVISYVHLQKVLDRNGILHVVNTVASGERKTESLSRWVFWIT